MLARAQMGWDIIWQGANEHSRDARKLAETRQSGPLSSDGKGPEVQKDRTARRDGRAALSPPQRGARVNFTE